METTLRKLVARALAEVGASDVVFTLEHPNDPKFGDYATNAALVAAKSLSVSPRQLAEDLVQKIRAYGSGDIAALDVAGAGFINFRLTDESFVSVIDAIDQQWGKTEFFSGKRVIVEYTDLNPFKEFHVGHLMPNTIGESVAQLFAWGGADVKRATYHGDIGMHVAKCIWGIEKTHSVMPREEAGILEKAKFLGDAYAHGAQAFEEDETAKAQITNINKKIYTKGDPLIDALYTNGKRWSLEYFAYMYDLLETHFDLTFFESETATRGEKVVREHLGSVFQESNGAIVFPGEQYGLHTRVFINSEGLPTYESKEIGLAIVKYETFPYDQSVVVTANEITDYFRVLLKAIGLVFHKEQLAEKTTHLAHGMMRLTNGKISSRKGNVPTAIALIEAAQREVTKKISEDRGFSDEEKEKLSLAIAVGAIRYTILRQQFGQNIIFDFETSLSFDGDSGPYLQYTVARIHSLLEKAGDRALKQDEKRPVMTLLERSLVRFPEIVTRAQDELAPHHIANYLIALAREFNAFYAHTQIIGGEFESYYLKVSTAVKITLINGLTILGIPVVRRM